MINLKRVRVRISAQISSSCQLTYIYIMFRRGNEQNAMKLFYQSVFCRPCARIRCLNWHIDQSKYIKCKLRNNLLATRSAIYHVLLCKSLYHAVSLSLLLECRVFSYSTYISIATLIPSSLVFLST